MEDLIRFRTHDGKVSIVRSKTYLNKMKMVIKKTNTIPLNDPITMAVDIEKGIGLLWEGNHRTVSVI